MSLDVYLSGDEYDAECTCNECGHKHTVRRADEIYSANITHNLGRMADAVGIYQALWRPEEIGVTRAAQLIEPLAAGLALLKSDPARFEAFNATNGWGLYVHFVPFVERYLEACRESPEARVRVSR